MRGPRVVTSRNNITRTATKCLLINSRLKTEEKSIVKLAACLLYFGVGAGMRATSPSCLITWGWSRRSPTRTPCSSSCGGKWYFVHCWDQECTNLQIWYFCHKNYKYKFNNSFLWFDGSHNRPQIKPHCWGLTFLMKIYLSISREILLLCFSFEGSYYLN